MPDTIITAQDVADSARRRPLGDRLAEGTHDLRKLKKALNETGDENKRLRGQVRELKADIKKLQGSYNDLEDKHDQVRTDYETALAEIAESGEEGEDDDGASPGA